MFTIYEYYDMEALKNVIRSCHGDVLLPMEDGTVVNLKEMPEALDLLLQTGIGKKGLKVRLTNQLDLISFVWLTLQAA